jgi:hypothetical protein
LVNAEDGQAVFTEEGEPSEFLNTRQQFLSDLANSELLTQQFVKKIVDLGLLEAIEIGLEYTNGQKRNVTGMMSIDEKKLRELDQEVVMELHKNGFMGAIYATMISLGQLNRLVELSNNTDSPIASLHIRAAKPEGQAENA